MAVVENSFWNWWKNEAEKKYEDSKISESSKPFEKLSKVQKH